MTDSVDIGPRGPFENPANFMRGDWLDTYNAFGGSATVRFRPDLFSGAIAVHCHILIHGDAGQMGTLVIDDGCDAFCEGNGCPSNKCRHCPDSKKSKDGRDPRGESDGNSDSDA